jgi:hypothetical protein
MYHNDMNSMMYFWMLHRRPASNIRPLSKNDKRLIAVLIVVAAAALTAVLFLP